MSNSNYLCTLTDLASAIKEGKQIEYCEMHPNSEWRIINPKNFLLKQGHYRVVPSPRYRPYTSVAEAKHLMGSYMFKYDKDTGETTQVDMVTHLRSSKTDGLIINDCSAAFVCMHFKDASGNPIGIKE